MALSMVGCGGKDYSEVKTALAEGTWYFNGGSDTVLNNISFSEEEATIGQVYYDGNGKHDNGSAAYSYALDDENITVTMADENELKIPYTLDNGAVKLGSGDYYIIEEIDAGLQGYWKMRKSEVLLGMKSENEKNIYINDGKVISEKASLAMGSDSGEYYYYGPYEGTYTLNFGGFDTDMSHGNEWFFNIIDGKVTLLNYDTVCTPSDKLPGENGYSFK